MDPLLWINYGVQGSGKSSDLVYAAPMSHFIAELAAVRLPAATLCGIEIPDSQVSPPDTIKSAMDMIVALAHKRAVASVVVDDFSLVAQRSFRFLESKGLKGFPLFGAFRSELLDFREAVRRCGIHVFVNAHEGPRHVNELTGRPIRGGPQLPGTMQEDITAVFDTVLHVVRNPQRPMGWSSEVHCGDDDDWVTKDRLSVISGVSPFNTGEVFRARGIKLPRVRGLEWLDEAIPRLCQNMAPHMALLVQRTTANQVMSAARAFLAANYTKVPQHQNWALRDAVDRLFIRATLTARESGSLSIFGG